MIQSFGISSGHEGSTEKVGTSPGAEPSVDSLAQATRARGSAPSKASARILRDPIMRMHSIHSGGSSEGARPLAGSDQGRAESAAGIPPGIDVERLSGPIERL
jgi:hypothetical protein